MKKLILRIGGVVLFTTFFLSCSKNPNLENPTTLKQALNQSSMNLNTAMNAITASRAYGILTVSDVNLKSASVADSAYRVNITLDKINGVYDYNHVTRQNLWGLSLLHFFTRTADNSHMIVRMPLQKVTRPRSLRFFSPADSSLTNNFKIDVSDYHNDYNSFWDYDYLLNSEISVDSVVAGNLNIKSLVSPTQGIHYSAQYAFTDKYTAKYMYDSGDTTVSSFAIMNGTNVLYEEKLLTIRNDTVRFGREFEYILTIGNVQITRKSGTKAVEISVNGVVQQNAVVEIIDREPDSEASVCKKRDVKITFDDGTSDTISNLIGKSVDNIKTLYTSLHQVFFAAYIVDWIAYDIYYQRN